MAKKRKTYRVADFKRWLKKQDGKFFGSSDCDCPMSAWLGHDVTIKVLDTLPQWINRFVGRWDASVPISAGVEEINKVLFFVLPLNV